MAQSDGTIIIDTSIRTDGMKEGGKEVEAAMRRSAKAISGIGKSAKLALQKQVDAFIKSNQQCAQQEEKVESLKKKLAEMSNQKVPTQEYEAVTKEIQKLETALDKAIEKQIKFVETGGNKESRTFAGMEYDIEKLNQSLTKAIANKKRLETSGAAYTTPDTSGLESKYLAEKQKLLQMNSALNTSYDTLKNKMSSYGVTVSKTYGIKARLVNIFGKVSKAASKFGASLANVDKKAKNTNFSLGKMLATSLLFSTVFRAISLVTGGIKEGFENLAQYSGETNADISMLVSSLTQLKNSFATAFSPILSVVAPILSKFINMLSQAITYVGMFFAALTGKKSFTKAKAVQQNYAAGLKETGSAAKEATKELEGYLSPIDEINKMEKQDTSQLPDSSGGGRGGGLSPGQMFETVPIESHIAELAEKVKKTLAEMFAPLKDAWEIYGPSIKNSLNLILQDFINFGKRIGLATIDWFKNLDWKPLLASVDELLKKLEPLVNIILNGLAWGWENILLPLGKWTLEEGLPALITLVGNAFEFLTVVLEKLQPIAQWLWDNFLKDFGSMAGEVAVGIITAFSGVLEFFTGFFSGNWDQAISGLKTAVQGLEQAVMAVFDFIQNNIMIPFDNFLQGVFATDWTEQFGIFGEVLNGFMAGVSEIWDGIKTIFNGIITFLKGAFSGSWRQVWEGIKQIFSGVWEGMKGIVNTIGNSIIGAINGLISGATSGINAVIDLLNGLSFDIPDWVPKFGGEKFGFDIPKVTAPRIPYLATGAVIPPNAPFMAMLGDQKNGNNLEMPESLLRRIVREETGGNRNSGGTYRFIGQLNRRVLFDEFIEEAKMRQSANGLNPFYLR